MRSRSISVSAPPISRHGYLGATFNVVRREVAQLMPPYRVVAFWSTQALVLMIALVHDVVESVGLLPHFGLLYFVPISLFFIPVVYAAVNFGFRGSVATALWCVVITIPNWVFWHSGLERAGVVFQMLVMVAIAAFVGDRVDRQLRARSRAEEASRALEVSELKYRGLFETAGEGVLVVDKNGCVVECNAAAGLLLGSSPGELRHMPLAKLRPPHLASALLDAARRDGDCEAVRLVDPEGKEVWVEPVWTSLPEGEGLAQVVLRNVTEQKRRQAGLETYAAHILRAQEEERQRIAQELHDETVQSLVLLCRKLDAAVDGHPGAPASDGQGIEQAREYTERIAGSLRGLIRGLRPLILDDLGLVPALRRQLTEIGERSPIRGRLMAESDRRLAPDAELALFRVAQEALRNVEKHSGARHVEVSLDVGSGQAKLVIADDGVGFSMPASLNDFANDNKLGLLGMRERARILGGRLVINSTVGAGTKVIAQVPIG